MLRAFQLRRRADALLAAADLASSALSCWLAYRLRFEGQLPLASYYADRYLYTSIGVCIAFVAVARAAGLYRRACLRPGGVQVEDTLKAGLGMGVALAVVDYAGLDGALSRAWVALVSFFLILCGLGTRAVLSRGRRALVPLGIGLERYALVGDGGEARRLHGDLTRAAGAPFVVVDVLSPDLGAEALADAALAERLDGLIFTADTGHDLAASLSGRLAGHGIDAFVAPRFLDLDMRVASIATFHGVPLLRVAGMTPRRPAVRTRAPGNLRHGVAIMGTRGIPANYGGFETFAERLALHLVACGIPVTVFCRRHHATAQHEWHGVRLVTLPTIRNKYLDTVVHTLLSAVHLVLRTRITDLVLCNAANAPVLPLLRVARRRVVMNVDGLEWRRGKWGIAGRAWYRMGEWLSVRASSVLVTDAEEVRTYYRVRHDTESIMIPYGADLLPRRLPLPPEIEVEPDAFALYVSRWEPENNPLMVARAHAEAGVDMPLVMLGRATYDERLEQDVRAAAAANALLPGPIFGDGYRALQSNARCYVHATEVGGTHPALIEAMGAGNHCLVLDTPENREVAGPDAWFFADDEELAQLLRRVSVLGLDEVRELGERSRKRANDLFSWTAVGDAYLSLLVRDPPAPEAAAD